MKLRIQIMALVLLLIACGTALGQVAQKAQAIAAAPAASDRARFEQLRDRGFDAVYNLDYASARQQFNELVKTFPDHPAGPQFLAATLWLQRLNESRRLQSSLYNDDSFYAQQGGEDKVDAKTVAQFREWTRQAKALAEARLKRDAKDTEAMYFLGATQALKAAFEAAVERRFLAALRDGSDAVDKHREVMKLDPNFHDAELSIGINDYIVGGLPLPFKLMANVVGERGSKRRGIETLQRVAAQASWARDDAKVLLITIMKREKRYADALAISRELSVKYPRNYIFKMETADALVSQAAVERQAAHAEAASSAEREAFAVFDALLRDRNAREAAARYLDLIHFKYGEALQVAGQHEHAAQEFLAAANVAGGEASVKTMAHLKAAQSLDLAGKRKEALEQYSVVMLRPNVYDSLDEAKQGMREAYKVKVK
jgi:hypothetical protein